MKMKTWALPTLVTVLSTVALSACDSTNPRIITILATNDIHGGIEPQKGSNENAGANNLTGGLAFFSGAVKAIKQGLQKKYGDHAGVLVVDAGDQFQGTLISNYTEGSLVFAAMDDVGYDAVITGNHDYDFGPHDWLVDDIKYVDPKDPNADRDPRGVIKDLAARASFPIISANTYIKDSILNKDGKRIDVSSQCTPAVTGTQIDWTKAQRPEFLKPYVIKEIVGARVALIGIDTTDTPTTTTPANVSDLCFRDEFEAYKDVRTQLEGLADVFVLVIHDGNSNNDFRATTLVKKLLADDTLAVDAVVSGHTHYVYNVNVNNVPLIQSGHGGALFGRIDLVYDPVTRLVQRNKTAAIAGAHLDYSACDSQIQSFCSVTQDGVSYEGVPVTPDQDIQTKIAAVKTQLAPMASRVLGHASTDLKVDRINESALADALTDAFRAVSGSEIALMNTGGMRTDLKPGDVKYEDLFEVLPFNNHGYVVGPMKPATLISLLAKSVKTCGDYGALMQSGLRVSFTRDCSSAGVDPKAQLVHVETLAGEVIYDQATGVTAKDSRIFNVATLDFLSEGGAGYSDFIGTPKINDIGNLREVLAEGLVKSPAQWSGTVDGRWKLLPKTN
jgi:5'-nucleotidase